MVGSLPRHHCCVPRRFPRWRRRGQTTAASLLLQVNLEKVKIQEMHFFVVDKIPPQVFWLAMAGQGKGKFQQICEMSEKNLSSAVDKYLRRWNSLRNPALPTWGRSSARLMREDQVEREWKGRWETFWGFARSLLCKVIYVWSIWKSWQLDWQTCLVQKLEVMPICQFFIGRLNDLIKDIGLMKLVMQVREGVQKQYWK